MNQTAATTKTAVALGFFDGVHRGHRAVVEAMLAAARTGGLTPAVFTFPPGPSAPAAKRGQGFLTTEAEKEAELRALGAEEIFCPDFEEFQNMSGEEFVRGLLCGRYGAKALCCGYDFRFGKGAGCGVTALQALCEALAITLTVVPAVLDDGAPVSSTRIREALAQGEIETVNRLLGRRYGFCFEVTRGRRLGTTIGFPTINQPLPQGMALPRFGVYAAFAQVAGQWLPAVTNIGVNPTVENDYLPLAETHIFGASGELYGEWVPLCLVRFLRGEFKFSSVEEMLEHIRRDAAEAAEICSLQHI